MTTAWDNREEAFPPQNNNDKPGFPGHDEQMKRFRLGHPDWAAAGARYVATVDYFALLPLRRVNLDRFFPN